MPHSENHLLINFGAGIRWFVECVASVAAYFNCQAGTVHVAYQDSGVVALAAHTVWADFFAVFHWLKTLHW